MVQEIPKSDQSYRHYGERFVLVLDGTIDLSIGDSTQELKSGDTVHYGAHQEHTISAKTVESARVLMISSPGIL
ncbi:MAG: cupin domain-containing protein [Acidimicrobiales bacterium]